LKGLAEKIPLQPFNPYDSKRAADEGLQMVPIIHTLKLEMPLPKIRVQVRIRREAKEKTQ